VFRNVTGDIGSIVSAVFNYDGSGIFVVVNFSVTVAHGSRFSCASLLSFKCVTDVKCSWVNSSLIYVYLYDGVFGSSCVSPGDEIGFAQNMDFQQVRSFNLSKIELTLTKMVTIQVPLSAQMPKSSLTTRPYVGQCSSMILDMSTSAGNCGRQWTTSILTVSNSSIASLTTISELNNLIQNQWVLPESILVLPSRFSIVGNRYIFSLKLCNFMNQCSQTTQSVSIMDDKRPVVTIGGAGNRTIVRNQALSLTCTAYIPVCQEETNKSRGILLGDNTFDFEWTILINETVLSEFKSIQ
jgi:hypothetical protein